MRGFVLNVAIVGYVSWYNSFKKKKKIWNNFNWKHEEMLFDLKIMVRDHLF